MIVWIRRLGIPGSWGIGDARIGEDCVYARIIYTLLVLWMGDREELERQEWIWNRSEQKREAVLIVVGFSFFSVGRYIRDKGTLFCINHLR